MTYYVYQYIDPRNKQPFYIGKGQDDRMYSHLNETEDKTCNKFKFNKIKSIRDSGKEPIVEVIQYFDIEQEAYDFENFLIHKYGRKGYEAGGILTNITIDNKPPSRKGKKLTLEQKENMSKIAIETAKTRKKSTSPPWNKGLKNAQVPWNKGLTGLTHKPPTEETKQKIREANIGKTKSPETRAKMSKNMKGRIPWHKGKNITTYVRPPITLINPDGEHIT